MLISLNWLKDFVTLPKNIKPTDLATELTLKTAEVESVRNQSQGLEDVVVGEILEIKKHPNADKLNLAKVNIGKKEPLHLIFGQMVTMKVGNKIPVAIAPTTLPTGIHIEKKPMRGEMSEGMLCLDQELGLEREGVSIHYFPNLKPGTPIAEALNLDDIILEFDNKALTHRPDLWGHYGIAREIAALTNSKFKPLQPKPKIPKTGETVKIEVKESSLCPRYCGLIIDHITVGKSPEWLQKRLRATGHGAHNNIVDVTNYVMAELGQPMHAFDKKYIKGGIVVRRANKNESIPCLDGKIRELTTEMLVIADHERPVAIAGIIGGENSGVNEKTTSIILESANFNSANIRRTSPKFALRTEAVQRFEKALDPNLAELAILRAAELILQICPKAKISGPITDIQNFSKTPTKITLDIAKTQSKIGAKIPTEQIKQILEKLEFKVAAKGTGQFTVTVPTFRASKDIKIEDDLIEEIARIYGYESLPAHLPTLPTKLPMENAERFKKHRARELLSYGLGFDEVYNYSFYGQTEIKNCLLKEEGHIKLLNYLSADQTHLRTTLTPNILKNLQQNSKNLDTIKIYEIGRTYKEINKYMPLEEKKITGAISIKGKSDEAFSGAKGVVETIFKKFAVALPAEVKEIKNTPYAHSKKALSYLDKNAQTLAKVFILHPIVAKNYELENFTTAVFAINFTELMKLAPEPKIYQKISRFPSIEIDISVLIKTTTEIKTIQNAITKADKNLIVNVGLFDIYKGPNIAADKKAVAFKITLQSRDRTLTDAEMTQVQNKIFKNLEGIGGIIRGK